MNDIPLSYLIELVASAIAIFVPIFYPFRLLKQQIGIYRISVIYGMSLIGAIACYFTGVDTSIAFTRIFFLAGIMTVVSLCSEIRASNLVILGRSEFIHQTVNDIIKVDTIIKDMKEVEEHVASE